MMDRPSGLDVKDVTEKKKGRRVLINYPCEDRDREPTFLSFLGSKRLSLNGRSREGLILQQLSGAQTANDIN